MRPHEYFLKSRAYLPMDFVGTKFCANFWYLHNRRKPRFRNIIPCWRARFVPRCGTVFCTVVQWWLAPPTTVWSRVRSPGTSWVLWFLYGECYFLVQFEYFANICIPPNFGNCMILRIWTDRQFLSTFERTKHFKHFWYKPKMVGYWLDRNHITQYLWYQIKRQDLMMVVVCVCTSKWLMPLWQCCYGTEISSW